MIGNFDNTNNIIALLSSLDTRVADDNTGNALTYNGPQAPGTTTGTPVNTGTGYAFVYNSGSPYYYMGVDDAIDYDTGLSPLSASATATYVIDMELSDMSTYQILQILEENGGGDAVYFDFQPTGQLLRFRHGSYRGEVDVSGGVVSLNTRFQVIVSYDGGGATDDDKVKIYIDGTAKTVTHVNAIPTTYPTYSTSDAYLGRSAGSGIIDGRIYNFVVYTDAKSASWVSTNSTVFANDNFGVTSTDNGDGTLTLTAISSNVPSNVTVGNYGINNGLRIGL